VIVGWQIYQITHDPLSLGLLGLAEALAFIAFALWAGHITDRGEKRRLIILSETVALLSVIALLGLTLADVRQTFPFYLVIGFSGMARAFLWSSSTALSEMIVPVEIYSSAAAWNSSAWEIASILGPATGGILYGVVGPAASYAVATLIVAISLIFAFELKPCHPVPGHKEVPIFESLQTGIRFVFRNEIILTALALDMFAVLFGGAVALLPVIAEERLGVGDVAYGWLRAAPGMGAAVMAVVIAVRPVRRRVGNKLLVVVGVFGACTVVLGITHSYVVAFAMLILLSAADMVSVFIRGSLVPLLTPDEKRGRVLAVENVFIGASNELGAFESGVAAQAFGTPFAVIGGGVGTLAVVGLWAVAFPSLRRIDRFEDLTAREDPRSD